MRSPLLGTSGRQEMPTSLSLLVRLRAHDDEAWRVFLSLYTPLVVRWCQRRGLTETDTADVAQTVFCKVLRSLEQFRKEHATDSFRGWLCRITHHEVAQFHRQRDRLATPLGGSAALQQLHQHPDPSPVDAEADVSQETRYLYHRAVQLAQGEFSAQAWQMFWRVAVDGNSATAVAEEMGVTSAAVRQAKSRILRRLKQLVGDLSD